MNTEMLIKMLQGIPMLATPMNSSYVRKCQLKNLAHIKG
jgi:hypothetical protein